MYIHWFPGHMTKAFRVLEQNLSLVDSVIYVLDARAPKACINEEFNRFVNKMPILYVLNKSDLISKSDLSKWLLYFNQSNKRCIAANSLSMEGAKIVKESLRELHSNLVEKYIKKGTLRTPRSIVIGVPNTGKSSLINNLAARKKLETANKPGVTRAVQWIKIDNNIELMDSPGLLFPDFKDQDKAFKLAAIGSIRDERFDFLELADKLFCEIKKIDFQAITNRYSGIEKYNQVSYMEAVALSRSFLISGGRADIERGAKAFINDFRKGFLGKICLENPA